MPKTNFFAVAMLVSLTLVLGCQTPDPEQRIGRFELHYQSPDAEPQQPATATITGVEQERRWIGQTPADIRPTLAVDVKLEGASDSAPQRIERSDIDLIVGTAEGTEIVANNTDEIRSPDRLHVERDGNWVETESVEIGGQNPTRLRLRFDYIMPVAIPSDRPTARYSLPVDMHLSIPTGDDSTTELALTERQHPAPVWSRNSLDSRLFLSITGGTAAFEVGHAAPVWGLLFGNQTVLPNNIFVRWGADLQIGAALQVPQIGGAGAVGTGELYMQIGTPLMAGYNIALPAADIGLTAGWVPSMVVRGSSDEPAFPHWAAAELTFSPSRIEQYPFQSTDFLANFSVYTRYMHQLGNFAFAERDEPGGFMLTAGFAYHPLF